MRLFRFEAPTDAILHAAISFPIGWDLRLRWDYEVEYQYCEFAICNRLGLAIPRCAGQEQAVGTPRYSQAVYSARKFVFRGATS